MADLRNGSTVGGKTIENVVDSQSKANKALSDAKTYTDSKLSGIDPNATKVEDSAINGNIKINGSESVVYTHPTSHPASMITQDVNNRFVTDAEKVTWNDKYTKNEVDTKISNVITSLDWKESVATFNDIATTYTTPEDGWTVSVKDTDTVYRYNGSSWVAISANSIPLATQAVDGKMSATDKIKLDGITVEATKVEDSTTNGNIKINGTESVVYTHPTTHPASIITQDANNRFVTDTEKSTWNAKASTAVATTNTDGLMSSADKTKLDGVAAGATKVEDSITNGNIKINGTENIVYTHPANHPASIITQDASNRFVTDTEKATWNGKLDSTANAVSASKLATARTISLTGDITGSVSFDGSANASITTTIADDSHNHTIANIDNLQTALDDKAPYKSYIAVIQGQTWSRILQMSGSAALGHNFLLNVNGTRTNVIFNTTFMISTSNSGTSQGNIVQIASNSYSILQIRTVVDVNGNGYVEVYDNQAGIANTTTQNLEISYLNINNTTITPLTTFSDGTTLPANHNVRGQITTVPGATFVGDLSGNASTASKLETARTISLTGGVTGSVTFDGSANASISTTVSNSSHNHTLDSLSNTTITSNTVGEILKWNGTAWINNTLAEAGIATASHNHDSTYVNKTGDTMSGALTIATTNDTPLTLKATDVGTTAGTKEGGFNYITWQDAQGDRQAYMGIMSDGVFRLNNELPGKNIALNGTTIVESGGLFVNDGATTIRNGYDLILQASGAGVDSGDIRFVSGGGSEMARLYYADTDESLYYRTNLSQVFQMMMSYGAGGMFQYGSSATIEIAPGATGSYTAAFGKAYSAAPAGYCSVGGNSIYAYGISLSVAGTSTTQITLEYRNNSSVTQYIFAKWFTVGYN